MINTGRSAGLLGTQLPKDRQGSSRRPRALLAYRPDTRWASVFTRTSRDEFARARQKHVADPVERFAESNPSGIRVIQVQVRLEEFLLGTGRGRELLPFKAGACTRRPLPPPPAQVS